MSQSLRQYKTAFNVLVFKVKWRVFLCPVAPADWHVWVFGLQRLSALLALAAHDELCDDKQASDALTLFRFSGPDESDLRHRREH